MAIEYRRKIGTQVWHFDRDCLLWPTRFDFVVLYDRPHDRQTCKDCIVLTQHERQAGTPISSAADVTAQTTTSINRQVFLLPMPKYTREQTEDLKKVLSKVRKSRVELQEGAKLLQTRREPKRRERKQKHREP